MDLTNPSIHAMIPLLFGGRGEGSSASGRTAFVQDNVRSTIVIPGDWPDKQDRWYEGKANFAARPNNAVKYLIDGKDTYASMVAAIATATEEHHFVVLIGWSLDFDFALDGEATGKTLRDVLVRAYDVGVWLRILRWRAVEPLHEYVASMWKGVETFAASFTHRAPEQALLFLDEDVRPKGSHHQKILLVSGGQGLIGFFGGVDFYRDRVMPGAGGAPQHDVHAAVTGSAAKDLYEVARRRFEGCSATIRKLSHEYDAGWGRVEKVLWDPPASILGTPAKDALKKLLPPFPAPPPSQPVTVRIAQTVGNPNILTPSDLVTEVKHAIGKAQRFIYMEDQYFWSRDVADALNSALRSKKDLQLIILLPLPAIAAMGNLRRAATARLLKDLTNVQKNNISICHLKPANTSLGAALADATGCYVHAKTWIFDDELAIIGSANCNNRGYAHDSEVIGMCSDPDCRGVRAWHQLELNLAHKLRVTLWAQHLGRSNEDVHDPLAAALYWRHPTVGGRIGQVSDDAIGWWDARSKPGNATANDVARWVADPER